MFLLDTIKSLFFSAEERNMKLISCVSLLVLIYASSMYFLNISIC